MNSEQSKPSGSFLSSLSNAPQASWQQSSLEITQSMKRAVHVSVTVDNYLVVIGGSGSPKAQLLFVFDMQKETCPQVEISGEEIPKALVNHSACYWKDRQIIVYGGKTSFLSRSSSTVAIITLSDTEPLTAQWRTIKTGSDIARGGHTAHIYKDQMIVFGGRNESDRPSQAIHSLNLNDFTWTELEKAQDPQKVFIRHKSILYGDKIYVFAEIEHEDKITFRSLDLETCTWKQLPLEIVYSHFDFAAIEEYKGKIYLAYALIPHPKLNLQCFDIEQERWISHPQLNNQILYGKKSHFSLNVWGNKLVLYGKINTTVEESSHHLWFLELDTPQGGIQQQPKENMIQDNIMKRFLREAPYSDIVFEVESELIPAHKWWLCKRSRYFANMFSSGMIEAKSSKIAISDMSAATFRGFLEYLYSDDVGLDVTLAKELLTQADKYSVPELKGLCEQFLIGNITTDNYVLLSSLSELLEANKLRDAVRDYISKNIKTLKSRKDFEEISMDMLRDVVIKVTVR